MTCMSAVRTPLLKIISFSLFSSRTRSLSLIHTFALARASFPLTPFFSSVRAIPRSRGSIGRACSIDESLDVTEEGTRFYSCTDTRDYNLFPRPLNGRHGRPRGRVTRVKQIATGSRLFVR